MRGAGDWSGVLLLEFVLTNDGLPGFCEVEFPAEEVGRDEFEFAEGGCLSLIHI